MTELEDRARLLARRLYRMSLPGEEVAILADLAGTTPDVVAEITGAHVAWAMERGFIPITGLPRRRRAPIDLDQFLGLFAEPPRLLDGTVYFGDRTFDEVMAAYQDLPFQHEAPDWLDLPIPAEDEATHAVMAMMMAVTGEGIPDSPESAE